MNYEAETESTSHLDLTNVPPDLQLTDQLLSALRGYLQAHDLDSYQIYFNVDLDVEDIDKFMAVLDEQANWEAVSPTGRAEALVYLDLQQGDPFLEQTGCLHLRKHHVVLARFQWIRPQYSSVQETWFCAAPTPEHYLRLRKQVRQLRREKVSAVWQIVRGRQRPDGPSATREEIKVDGLVFSPALRRRVESEIVQFFDEPVAAMYRSMGVAYRRGVLLHGPPGNGKTSLIRHVGSTLRHLPAMLLRPHDRFSGEDLQSIMQRWARQAPAILVIEDLNWMLKSIDLSLFLNLLDGIESPTEGGLLLLATTNHPNLLDPAINNRPGRFDVVIEIPSPDDAMRLQFLGAKLHDVSDSMIQKLVTMTDGLAFAHLHELLRLSGLLAIHAGRQSRNDDDLLAAASSVRDTNENASRGFRSKPDIPFGLGYLHTMRK